MKSKIDALKELRDYCRIQQAMYEDDQIEVGDFTYGKPIIRKWDNETKLKIGKFCSIGGEVQILMGGEHHTEWITTYPFNVFLADQYGFKERLAKSKGDITIGNDVWIGNNAIILSGVTIGDGAVIGAGAVVTRDVRPFSIVGGVPADFIRYRYAAHNLKNWDKLTWWDWPIEKLALAVPLLLTEDVDSLVEFDRGWPDGH